MTAESHKKVAVRWDRRRHPFGGYYYMGCRCRGCALLRRVDRITIARRKKKASS